MHLYHTTIERIDEQSEHLVEVSLRQRVQVFILGFDLAPQGQQFLTSQARQVRSRIGSAHQGNQDFGMFALQVAAVHVNRGLLGVQFRPDSRRQIGQQLRRRVDGGWIGRALSMFRHTANARVAEQRTEDRLLTAQHSAGGATCLEPHGNLRCDQLGRRLEHLLNQERHRFLLAIGWNRMVDLIGVTKEEVDLFEAAHHAGNMSQFTVPLGQQRVVHVLQHAVVFVGFAAGRDQVICDAVNVQHAHSRRFNGIPSEVFALAGRVLAGIAIAEPQQRVGLLLGHEFGQPLVFFFLIVELTITPFHGKMVVGGHDRDQRCIVPWLCHVVKTAVVHDRGFGAVGLGEVRAPQVLDRVGRRRFHVVREAQRMSDFMRHDVSEQFTHQFVRQRQFLGPRIVG